MIILYMCILLGLYRFTYKNTNSLIPFIKQLRSEAQRAELPRYVTQEVER